MFVCSPTRLQAFRAPVLRAVTLAAAMAAASAARAQGPFVVTTTADSGVGSLRQAILDAGAGTGGAITFNIPTSDAGFNLPGSPGAWRITVMSALPALSRATAINGLSQPGATCAQPRIELRPADPAATTGLILAANGCEVRGLVINGFSLRGVHINAASGCTVACNIIGSDVTGTIALGNGVGIRIDSGMNNTIGGAGGAGVGLGNLVAGNIGAGVEVVGTGPTPNVGNPILRNAIRGNGGLGIDLGANGVTANDNLDLDVGPNHFQNFPTITGYDGATISAVLASLPSRRFRIEFFANTVQDPSGFGEGAEFIDAVEVASNAGGSATISLPYIRPPGVRFVTATATALPPLRDSAVPGDIGPRGIAPAAPTGTSEFSPAFEVGPPSTNNPPVARDDSYATNEDTALVIGAPTAGVLANDSDPEGTALMAARVAGPSHGQLTLAPNGTLSYIPNPNFNGSDSFTYRASDGELVSNVATVTISVAPVNDAPFAIADEYTTDEDTPLVVDMRADGVLDNDIDAEGDMLTAALVSPPAVGTLVFAADGTFRYTPPANFFGVTTFTYRASDGLASSTPATVTIEVLAVNDPPVAAPDSYMTGFNTPLNIAAPGVLANDSDPEMSPLLATVSTPPTRGTVALNTNGSFMYTPNTGVSGVDSFQYVAGDGAADSVPATVTITVRGNTPPTAADDTYSTNEDAPLTVAAVNMGVLANDTDPEAPPQVLTAMLVTTTTRGSLTFSPNGTFNYNPQPNANGPDSFTYRVSDGFATSNTATVTINVAPVNDPPVARNDSYLTGEDTVLDVAPLGVLVNDSDVDDPISSLTVTITSPPANGALSNVAGGGFRYAPNSNFSGGDTFRYRLTDPTGAMSAIATVSITVQPINDPPVAAGDAYATDEDTPLSVAPPGVLSNDTDPDSPASSLRAQLVSAPSPAADFALAPDGSFTFTPALDFSGAVSFTYRASDGAATSEPATVTITVRPINDPPVAVGDVYETGFDTPLVVPVASGLLANDSDPDSPAAALTSQGASTAAHGELVLSPNGAFTYTPNSGYSGPDSFTYRAFDGELASNLATVSITVRAGGNQPPIARCRDVIIDARTTCPPGGVDGGGGFTITPADVNNGSSDPDDPADSLTLGLSSTGPFRIGVATVTLTVTDPHGASSMCTARVTVLGEDCDGNGVPDSCDIAAGAPDCNHDGIPDACQCLWDGGMAASVGMGGAVGGRRSQIGGRAQITSRVADDFYLEPGAVYRITSFSAQVLTNLAPSLRNARLEFLDDCNGIPQDAPIASFGGAVVTASEPAPGGFTLVTYTFNLCSANLWLEGGRVYWVSVTSSVPCTSEAESLWAFAPGEVMCSIPRVARGQVSPLRCTDVAFDPWLPADVSLGQADGCRNMAFKLGGAACPIIWDNGPYEHCPGGGGIPSGRYDGRQYRAADNFVVKPCNDQRVCFVEATIWTNGDPATGFLEIYGNDCKSPSTRLVTARVSAFIDLHETIRIGRVDVHAYALRFYDLDFVLGAGRTYWLSAGATCTGGSLAARSYFAIADRCGTACDRQISPAWGGPLAVGGPGGASWCPKAEDLAFRVAALPGLRSPTGATSAAPEPCPIDLNHDGIAGVEDLFEYLTAWFAQCP